MSNTRYCIICGEAFSSSDAQESLCEQHRTPHPVQSPLPLHGVSPEPAVVPGSAQQNGTWQPGQVILDTYQVKAELGKGGFGRVYRVHHKSWNIDLAVKRALNLDEKGKEAFVDEAQKWIDLGLHPHIISCYYVRNIDSFPHTFAELAEGGSLESWIQRGRHDLYAGDSQEVLSRILDIAIQFAWGLAYAHAQGLVHQDVKPGNALMTPDGILKVTDFGLARAKSQSAAGDVLVTSGGYTPAYCSPEQAAGMKLSLKTDIWSWAVSVLEMFNGGVSWMGGQVAASALESYLQRVGEDKDIPSMPGAVADLLRACLQSDPKARPKDMLEIADQLTYLYQQGIGLSYPRQVPRTADLRADSLNNRALSFLDLSKDEEAVENWQASLAIDPHHAETTYNMGMWRWTHAQQTDLDLVQQLNDVIHNQIEAWMPQYFLGMVHTQRHDVPAARQALDMALKLDQGNTQVMAAISNLKELNPTGCTHILESHTGSVMTLAITPDELKIVSGGDENMLNIWTFADGKCVSTLKGHEDIVTTVAITPDGRQVVSGSHDKTLRVWDLANHNSSRILEGHRSLVNDLKLFAGGRKMVSASCDQTLRVWNLASGKCLSILEGHKGSVVALAVSPDDRYVVSGGYDNTLRIWDVLTGTCLHTLDGHTYRINTLAITPNGQLIISGSEDCSLRVWELYTGKCMHVLSGHTDPVTTLITTCDGNKIISGDLGGTIRVWNLFGGDCVRILKGHTREIKKLAVTPDGRSLISGSRDHYLCVWNLHNGICLRTLEGHKDNVTSLLLTRQGHEIISGSWDRSIRIWKIGDSDQGKISWMVNQPLATQNIQETTAYVQQKLREAKLALANGSIRLAASILHEALETPGFERDKGLLQAWHGIGTQGGIVNGIYSVRTENILMGHTDEVKTLAVSPDGKRVVTGCIGDGHDPLLRIWDLDSGKCLHILKGHIHCADSLVISPDGSRVVSGSWDHMLHVWDMKSGDCLHVLDGRSPLLITPDGLYLISVRGRSILSVWDLASGTLLQSLKGHTEEVDTLAITQDGKRVISGDRKALRVWDLASGKCVRTMEGRSLALLTPDGEKVITKTLDHTIYIWELKSGEYLHILRGHKDFINVLAVTPDSRFIISGSSDRTLKVWDLRNGKCLRTLEGHTERVVSLVVTQNGHQVVSSSNDGTLRVWDLESGKCLQTLQGHTHWVRTLAITPDGRRIISGSFDFTIRVWCLDWDYIFPEPTMWDEGARPYLENFLTLHTPYAKQLPQDRELTDEEINLALTRRGMPSWSEDDFQALIRSLGLRGYGWLKPEGVRPKLEEMARERS